jgi:peptidyl-prolyl cis-trans isomerase D
MLQQIREKFTGGIAIAILALIGVPFLFFGVGNYSFFGQTFAAKVDGEEIGVAFFEQIYRDQLDRNPGWADLPDEFRVQLRSGVLDSLIRDVLVSTHLQKKGYQISDAQLMRAIQRVPEFHSDGKFDMDTYRTVLLQNGLEPQRFEASQRQRMREDQLRRAIGATALVTPSDYRRYLNLIAEQRLVSLATFDIASVAAGIEVTDEEIAEFYASNETMFLTPESADIEMIEIRRDAVAESIEIGEDVLVQYYEDEKDRYLQDEQRQARHILILFEDDEDAAEQKALDLLQRIRAGESFEELAQANSADGGTASNGGDLGVLTRSQLPGELGGAIFSMDEGDVDGPVKTDFGFHIVRLDDILERGPLPLDQVRGDLLTELRESEAESGFRDLERIVSDALFDAADMQAIADASGLEIQLGNRITRSGGDPVGSNQAAIDAIFDPQVLNGGEISEVIELDANRSAIFRVTAYYEASRQPLEAVRDEVAAMIKSTEAESIVFNRSEQLLGALDNGEDFGAAAEASGATVSAPRLVSRQEDDLDPSLLSQIYQAKKPTREAPTRGLVANADGGYTVFSLDAVLPGRPESIPLAERDDRKRVLTQEAGIADYSAFVQGLYNRADIVVSEDVLAAQDLFQ